MFSTKEAMSGILYPLLGLPPAEVFWKFEKIQKRAANMAKGLWDEGFMHLD